MIPLCDDLSQPSGTASGIQAPEQLVEINREEWNGLLAGQRGDRPDLRAVAVTRDPDPATKTDMGGSRPFQVKGNDARLYWVKVLNNPQGERVPVTEQIVARLGALIGAPTCEVVTIRIGEEFASQRLRSGIVMQAGTAHGSADIHESVLSNPKREPGYFQDDNNRERIARMHALYDWCWGGDPQWIYDLANENQIFSHDHGWYLPPTGATWTEEELRSCLEEPHPPPWRSVTTPPQIWNQVAEELMAIRRDELSSVLAAVPRSWPVEDEELEAVGWFLENRRADVARRLRNLAGPKEDTV